MGQQQDSNVFQSLSTESKRVISNRGFAQLRNPLYVVMLWVLTDLLATGADDVFSWAELSHLQVTEPSLQGGGSTSERK